MAYMTTWGIITVLTKDWSLTDEVPGKKPQVELHSRVASVCEVGSFGRVTLENESGWLVVKSVLVHMSWTFWRGGEEEESWGVS